MTCTKTPTDQMGVVIAVLWTSAHSTSSILVVWPIFENMVDARISDMQNS